MTDADELSGLTQAFADHLRFDARRGVRWVSACRSHLPANRGTPPRQPDPIAATASDVNALEHTIPSSGAIESLQQIRSRLGDCTRCRLHKDRKNLVFGVGDPKAQLMFVGEAPGGDEDRLGEPFVGRAGQLLTRMIQAMELTREQVYIANIIKCRPPQNRTPAPDEVAQCIPFVTQQIQAIAPQVIVALGAVAAQTLLRTDAAISRLRGRFSAFQGIPVMPTYHPAYLLRNPDAKRAAWSDLQLVMEKLRHGPNAA